MIYAFEDYSVDTERRELRRGMDLVSVEPQVFDLLEYLIRNRAHVVSKDEIISAVWAGRIIAESTLSSRITLVRHSIGDSGDEQRLIRTVPRKGVRFVGEVRENQCSGDAIGGRQEVGATTTSSFSGAAALKLSDKPSIAVLPFTNMSGDPEQEYFSDGIVEDIITALSRLRWFFVIARNSTFSYKGQPIEAMQVGRDLGVRYILEGSVRKSGQRVRITCQLIDATTSKNIWAERYDRELADIFTLQDEITSSVTAAIEPKLLAAEGIRTQARSVDDLDAWDLIARALSHFWKLNAVESAAAIAILRLAVQRHPDYAPAHSLLAFALLVSSHVGWIPVETNQKFAGRLADRAAELNESDPWAHMALGYLAVTARRTDEAVRHFQVALDLNPNFAAAYGFVGWTLCLDGRSDQSLVYSKQAVRMSPRDPFNGLYFTAMSAAYYMADRYHEAVECARRAVQLRPGVLSGYRALCASLAQAGQIEEAKSVMSKLRELQPNISAAWIREWVPYTANPMEKFLDGLRKAGLTE